MVELTWDGKYDANGKRVAPLRLKLPFQTVETVNASMQQRQIALDLFSAGRPSEWRNRLIWGDKKYVLPALLDEFAGKVDLIYIDPPFNVGANFSFTATIPDNPETDEVEKATFIKEPSLIEQKAYRDTWGRGLDSYLQWFYETTQLLREFLTERGSIYIHLDWHVLHYAKVVTDEIFGDDHLVEVTQKGRDVSLELTDFVIPPDDVPEDVQRAISHWSQWIDYWAVDWDNKGDTFHNQWQTYRTRQDKKLTLKTSKRYDQPGEYVMMVKVIDILGNDTTKTLKVKVV